MLQGLQTLIRLIKERVICRLTIDISVHFKLRKALNLTSTE